MTAPPYPKIENRFRRGEKGVLDLEQIRRPEFGLVDRWMVTEKVDGTNIRVSLEREHQEVEPGIGADRWVVRFYGRSNKAQMPDFIQEYLEATFKLDDMKQLWQGRRNCDRCDGTGREDSGQPKILSELAQPFPYACDCVEPYPITLYGEAYGARIQKGGGNYRRDGDISFRLFDVLVGERSWLGWGNTKDIADTLGILTVPLVDYGICSAEDIIDFVRAGFISVVAQEEGTPILAEGIVARTDPYLFDGQGRRVVWKIKTKEF